MRNRSWIAGLFLTALAPATLLAQGADRAWNVNLRAGPLLYAEASALETGAGIGIDAMYYITPRIAIGPTLDYVYAKTDGRFFMAVMDFGIDSTRIYQVGQNLGALHYGANVLVELMPGTTFSPYVTGGAGGYRLYLGAQSNDIAEKVSALMLQAGGGVRFTISDATGVQLDVRDVIYTDFDREELNPVRPVHRNRRPDGTFRFPGQEDSKVPDAEDTVHNIRLSVGFSYIPGTR